MDWNCIQVRCWSMSCEPISSLVILKNVNCIRQSIAMNGQNVRREPQKSMLFMEFRKIQFVNHENLNMPNFDTGEWLLLEIFQICQRLSFNTQYLAPIGERFWFKNCFLSLKMNFFLSVLHILISGRSVGLSHMKSHTVNFAISFAIYQTNSYSHLARFNRLWRPRKKIWSKWKPTGLVG